MMKIRVIDSDRGVHVYHGDGDFHTEELTNNLVIQTETQYAVYAEGKWVLVRKLLLRPAIGSPAPTATGRVRCRVRGARSAVGVQP
jgi:hypothetical protein